MDCLSTAIKKQKVFSLGLHGSSFMDWYRSVELALEARCSFGNGSAGSVHCPPLCGGRWGAGEEKG